MTGRCLVSTLLLLVIAGFLCVRCSCQQDRQRQYNIVLMPKSIDNPFFDVSADGCRDQAAQLSSSSVSVTCHYLGPPKGSNAGALQADMLLQLLHNETDTPMDALAISVFDAHALQPVLKQVADAGIPIVTFDSDALDNRIAYVGTDNAFFGRSIAKVLKQLHPVGGTYGIVTSVQSLNLQERAAAFVEELEREGLWRPVALSPYDTRDNITTSMEGMHALANSVDGPPTAIVPMMGMPMRSGHWKDFVDEHREKNIVLVSGDAMSNQLEFLARGYVQGLVGQLPYDFGSKSLQVLFDILEHAKYPDQDIIGTNVLTHLMVPLVLPELKVDHNLLGNLHWVGYILYGIIAVLAFGCAAWIYQKFTIHIVKVSQPSFLAMVVVGVVVMGSTLIPLSFDDKGDPFEQSDKKGVWTCMSVPWLASTGFTVTFSALFSKTLRINKIFHTKQTFARVRVTARDVLVPFLLLFGLNISILSLWTALDPLHFVRQDLPGTDGWNRVIATYGSCQSENAAPYYIPLAVVNLSVLIMANWQAYQARMIQSEFSESKYIGVAMASLLQAMLSGMPILFVVRESPQAYYLVLAFMIFIICTVVLLVIFVPKMVLVGKHANESEQEQKERIMSSIHQTRMIISNQKNGLAKQSQRPSVRSQGVVISGLDEGSGCFSVPNVSRETSPVTPDINDGEEKGVRYKGLEPLSIMDNGWSTLFQKESSSNVEDDINSAGRDKDKGESTNVVSHKQESSIGAVSEGTQQLPKSDVSESVQVPSNLEDAKSVVDDDDDNSDHLRTRLFRHLASENKVNSTPLEYDHKPFRFL